MQGVLEIALPGQSDTLRTAGHRIVADLCRLGLWRLNHLIQDGGDLFKAFLFLGIIL